MLCSPDKNIKSMQWVAVLPKDQILLKSWNPGLFDFMNTCYPFCGWTISMPIWHILYIENLNLCFNATLKIPENWYHIIINL